MTYKTQILPEVILQNLYNIRTNVHVSLIYNIQADLLISWDSEGDGF